MQAGGSWYRSRVISYMAGKSLINDALNWNIIELNGENEQNVFQLAMPDDTKGWLYTYT